MHFGNRAIFKIYSSLMRFSAQHANHNICVYSRLKCAVILLDREIWRIRFKIEDYILSVKAISCGIWLGWTQLQVDVEV